MPLLSTPESPLSPHPLDVLEELIEANDWQCERVADNELVAYFTGHWSDYRLFFHWHEELAAVNLSCFLDLKVPGARRQSVVELLALVNERLWLGHFELSSDELLPVFRHTLLLRGLNAVAVEQMEDLVDIALTESERFYPAFQYLIWGGHTPSQAIDAAILDTQGEA